MKNHKLKLVSKEGRTIDDYHNDSDYNRDRWQEVVTKQAKETVYYGEYGKDIRILVRRGGASLCAYVGIPIEHPLAGFFYDDMPLDCHGGLTFCEEGKKDNDWPEGFYWYGYDYAHAGDYMTYYDTLPSSTSLKNLKVLALREDRKWTIKDVKAEAESVAYDFDKLAQLAVKVKDRA